MPEMHLSLDELRTWAERGELTPENQQHLDGCALCQAIAEQLDTFSPRVAARRFMVLRAPMLPPEPARARGHFLLGAATALGLVASLSAGAWGWRVHERGHTQALEFASRRAQTMQNLVAQTEQRNLDLQKQLADATKLVNQINTEIAELPPEKKSPPDEHKERVIAIANQLRTVSKPESLPNVATVNVSSADGTNRFTVGSSSITVPAGELDEACQRNTVKRLADSIRSNNARAWAFHFEEGASDEAVKQALCASRMVDDHPRLMVFANTVGEPLSGM
jgi:hypothetical protein